ncbi:MAG TPA: hypothetical protein VGT99_12045 [Gammaproteobacteria bacterium]|nr:hypothetical protein [Gammaproteobacteria bacterium]
MNKGIWRSVWAVVAGVLVIVILSVATDAVLMAVGIMPRPGQALSDPPLALATFYRTVYSIAGAYLTAGLAPGAPMKHALALGALGVVLGLVGLIVTWNTPLSIGHEWYPIALVVLALPQCWLGGWLRVKRSHT